jgi:hypothetical protein
VSHTANSVSNPSDFLADCTLQLHTTGTACTAGLFCFSWPLL